MKLHLRETTKHHLWILMEELRRSEELMRRGTANQRSGFILQLLIIPRRPSDTQSVGFKCLHQQWDDSLVPLLAFSRKSVDGGKTYLHPSPPCSSLDCAGLLLLTPCDCILPYILTNLFMQSSAAGGTLEDPTGVFVCFIPNPRALRCFHHKPPEHRHCSLSEIRSVELNITPEPSAGVQPPQWSLETPL